MTLTTTVTWADLRIAHSDELDDLRTAYDEIKERATDEYGEDALNIPLPADPDLVDDRMDLYVYQQQAQQYEQAAESIEKRQHLLERLEGEYGSDPFELKMLSGEEAMDIETELRTMAQKEGVGVDVIQVRRNALTVDAATVDAPEGVPREDGSPKPSACPNALTLSLWEQVERFNNAGATDFRPEGFGGLGPAASAPSASSATPTPADAHSKSSETSDE